MTGRSLSHEISSTDPFAAMLEYCCFHQQYQINLNVYYCSNNHTFRFCWFLSTGENGVKSRVVGIRTWTFCLPPEHFLALNEQSDESRTQVNKLLFPCTVKYNEYGSISWVMQNLPLPPKKTPPWREDINRKRLSITSAVVQFTQYSIAHMVLPTVEQLVNYQILIIQRDFSNKKNLSS